ncbi:hypothetical protein IID10_16415 [candidate division KSB1 bacterium]|nr:hypothetical protein [candidate division KSB1 bacterium]
MDKIKKEKSMQEKIPEIFKIEKKGEKTKTKKLYPKEEIESVNKKEVIKKENKQLKVILGVIGILILAFLLVLLINYKTVNFNVEGVDFKIIKEGNLIFYNTFIKLYSDAGESINYNFYIRNNPKKLIKDVPFIGNLSLKETMVINVTTENLFCDGYWNIAMGNFINLHEIVGVKLIKDENASCELFGQYTFISIQEGTETFVKKFGPSCYIISVADCEILEGTERFMIETFVCQRESTLCFSTLPML